MASPSAVKWLALMYSLHKEHVPFTNKIIQTGQQEHPAQQLTTRLAIYPSTRVGAEVLGVISASFPCPCSKTSSRVKERKKPNKMQLRHTIVVGDPQRWDLFFL